jgi:hypothetical protein
MEQAELARRRSANAFDGDRVAEELLKRISQPGKRTKSWSTKIIVQRQALAKYLGRNPGVKAVQAEFIDAYPTARLEASTQTGLDRAVLPEALPFTMAQSKDEAWLPE